MAEIESFVEVSPRQGAKSAAKKYLDRRVEFVESPSLGQRVCWPMGDLFVGLECLISAVLWTTDSDFEKVSAATGRPWVLLNEALLFAGSSG